MDENGGFTIIPEMHLPFLSEEQRRNVRKIEGDYLSQRRISIYIREDYIRERMLNTLVDTLKMFIPEEMMGEAKSYSLMPKTIHFTTIVPHSAFSFFLQSYPKH